METRAYDYKHLKSVDSIRLLELLPGVRDSPLQCHIAEVQKSNRPEYEALSYAWGEAIFSHTIEEATSGTQLMITVNLHNALQGIRHQHSRRVLWVDAICINQMDLREKNILVAQMGRIYEDAERVVVWLGSHRGAPNRIISVLEDLVRTRKSTDTGPALRAAQRLHALQLMEQPWYSRVWVVQEFVLAQDLQFVTSTDIIPTQLLHDAIDCLLDFSIALKVYYTDIYEGYLRRLFKVAMLMSPMFDFRQDRSKFRRNQLAPKHEKSGISLASCLIKLSRGRECKNARDHLYAMLALAENNLGITPDYSLSLPTILNDFAKRSLHAGDLYVLHASGIRPDHASDLASFAPSVENWDNMTIPLNTPQLQFFTATQYPVTVSPTTAKIISIRGTRVDELSRIADIPGELGFAKWDKFEIWLGLRSPSDPGLDCNHMPRRTNSPQIGSIRSNWDNIPALMRSLGLPYPYTDTWLKIAIQLTTMGLVDWKHPFDRKGPISMRTAMYYRRLFESTVQPFKKHRQSFQTKQGYLGIGPFWMKPDDQVVTFDGGATPYILRKIVSEDGRRSDSWQLVGDCFLLGWMKGDYFGHTVVDDVPLGMNNNGEDSGSKNKKYLVKEYFTLV